MSRDFSWDLYRTFGAVLREGSLSGAARLLGITQPSVARHIEAMESSLGRSPNVPAPAIAKHYWKMAPDATLRDVVLLVRADEAHHRDVNHGFASSLNGETIDRTLSAPYPAHAAELSA